MLYLTSQPAGSHANLSLSLGVFVGFSRAYLHWYGRLLKKQKGSSLDECTLQYQFFKPQRV